MADASPVPSRAGDAQHAGPGLSTALSTVEGSRRTRLPAIDRLRGLVIVVMALDHVRDYFTDVRFDPTNLTKASVPLFVTRWITHLCAPTFVFLAGLSAFLMRGHRTPASLSRFLLTRGLWLLLLEVTVVHFVWHFQLSYRSGPFLQVIWAIGAAMVALAGLVWLPVLIVGAVGLALIAGHNLLDRISPDQLGRWAAWWHVLHVPGPIAVGFVAYPLLPWIGVMAAGFAFGALYTPPERRRSACLVLGASSCILFIALRLANGYGDSAPWSPRPDGVYTALSFVNVTKYPPSLDYVLMTLGPMLIALVSLERARGRFMAILQTFGQVPLFAYVGHLAIAHLLAGLVALALGYGDVILRNIFGAYPSGWGFGLPGVYLVWLIVLAALYPACRWFAGVKRTRGDWWLTYL